MHGYSENVIHENVQMTLVACCPQADFKWPAQAPSMFAICEKSAKPDLSVDNMNMKSSSYKA